MSKIIATDNFQTNNWILDTTEIGSHSNDLFIGFTDEAPIVEFKNLSFGYELRQNENIKSYGVYPPANTKYVRSDQEYLVSVRLNTQPNETYELFLWAENNSTRIEKTFELNIPKPQQPFESWTWNDINKTWEAPVPYPEDEKIYTWNEETQNWEEVTEEETN